MAQRLLVAYNKDSTKEETSMKKVYSKYGVRIVPNDTPKPDKTTSKVLKASTFIILLPIIIPLRVIYWFTGGSIGPNYITGPRGGRYTMGTSWDGGEYKRYR